MERGHAFLALARGDKEHRLLGGIEIDEHGDVLVAALGGGLVERDGLDVAEIEVVHGTPDVELQHAPEPLVGDPDDTGGSGDLHFAHQQQGGLFEQQGEAAVGTGPRDVDAEYSMVGAIAARDAGGDEAGVLEEAEMAPGRLLPVVRLAEPAAGWAREAGTGFGSDREVQ